MTHWRPDYLETEGDRTARALRAEWWRKLADLVLFYVSITMMGTAIGWLVFSLLHDAGRLS